MSIFHILIRCTKMEKTLHLHRTGTEEYEYTQNKEAFTCDECKGQFEKPIIATLSCQTGVQKYFACPHCLAQVATTQQQDEEPPRHLTTKLRDSKKPNTPTQSTARTACQHNVGYLRTRPKNTPIPEECLTCDHMVDCMLH